MGRVVKFAETWLEGMRVNVIPLPTQWLNVSSNPNMDESGSIDIRNFVMLGFGAVIVGAFVPMGINALGGADTANFTSTELALYSIVGVAILIAVVMMFINIAA